MMTLLRLFSFLAPQLVVFNLFANIGGTDLQNFNPLMGGLDFVTVHSARTLAPGQISVGAFGDFATNSLPYSSLSLSNNIQSFGNTNDQILYSHFHMAIGVFEGLELGVSSGFTIDQTLKQNDFLFSYGDRGLNVIRLAAKARLYKDELLAFGVVGGVDFEQIKDNPFVGDNAGPSSHAEAIAQVQLLPELLWAINLGARIRFPGTTIPNTGVTPLSHQVTYSSALSYLTDDWGSAVIAEIYGSSPPEFYSQPTDRQMNNLEILLGYRWMGLEDIDIHAGVGSAFYYGLGSPDMRFYLGLNWRLNLFQSE